MKVLALVVLIIAVSGLEAGVVKREVPNIPSLDELTESLKTWSENIKGKVEELFTKIHTPELQAHYNGYLDQARTHVDPVKAQLDEWVNHLKELINKKS